jgi:hypothetical protein
MVPMFQSLVEFQNDEPPMPDSSMFRLFESLLEEKAKVDMIDEH